MKRIVGSLLGLFAWITVANAQVYVQSSAGLLPPNTTPFQHYIAQQLKFMDHLRHCQPFKMEVRSPTQPSLLIVKEIFGTAGGFCRTQTMTYPANRQRFGMEPVIMNCRLSGHDMAALTTPDQYAYVKTLQTTNERLYTFSNLTPARATLHRNACHVVAHKH